MIHFLLMKNEYDKMVFEWRKKHFWAVFSPAVLTGKMLIFPYRLKAVTYSAVSEGKIDSKASCEGRDTAAMVERSQRLKYQECPQCVSGGDFNTQDVMENIAGIEACLLNCSLPSE